MDFMVFIIFAVGVCCVLSALFVIVVGWGGTRSWKVCFGRGGFWVLASIVYVLFVLVMEYIVEINLPIVVSG